MEAVPRLPMISCDIKISPSNTDFSHTLKKYIRDHYHEDPESYAKEIKELEALRQNAIKAPMDFTGCSILKRYYSQLHKLQSRFPMTDDGPACVPFMWTDIYSGVAYNITDIEYEEACILYNIGALHSQLGTVDSRCNAEGMKIACTHFQCSAWAFQHLRDTYPQPKGSDMSHDLLTYFINIMLAQAQECILEKSMLDSRKSSITAKIAAQVVDYYKCALGIMVSGSPSTDTGSILDIVGSKIFKAWKKFIEFKMSYYTSISHLYMGNQAEENEKWGERVAWFQSAFDHLTEAFKIAKNIDRDDLNEPLTFTMDVIGGKHSSSKKENEFVYHDKVPALTSLPELKGASLVKGIPFSITDPDVCGADIFARLVPMEAHETSSLYSEEKAKLLRSMVAKIEEKNEELMAYVSTLNMGEGGFEEDEKIPEELLEKCAAMCVKPNAITELQEQMNELLNVSKEVDDALKSASALLSDEEKKELQHQEKFGKRAPSMIIVELRKECSKYEEAHKKAIESNNTLETAVSIHISNLKKLLLPLEELNALLPSSDSIRTPDNVKALKKFVKLATKVEEMRNQRQFLEQKLRENLIKDDITKTLVTMKKKEDLQQTFAEQLKKHAETVTFLEQNLAAQDKILLAFTDANATYADVKKALTEISQQRSEMVCSLINSYNAYEDLMTKTQKGLKFYEKLQTSVMRLLTRVKGVTKVQDEERSQIAGVDFQKGSKLLKNTNISSDVQGPKLKDFLPYMTKQPGGGGVSVPAGLMNSYTPQHQIPATTQFVPESMRQATLGGPADFNRKLKPVLKDSLRSEEGIEGSSMGVRPAPVGSEQTVAANFAMTDSNPQGGNFSYPTAQQWPQAPQSNPSSASPYNASYAPFQYPTSSQVSPMSSSSVISPSTIPGSNVTYSQLPNPKSVSVQNYNPAIANQSDPSLAQYNIKGNSGLPYHPDIAPHSATGSPRYSGNPQPAASTAGLMNMSQVNGMAAPDNLPYSVQPPSTSPSPITNPAYMGTGYPVNVPNQPIRYNVASSQRPAIVPPASNITSPPVEQSNVYPHWQDPGQMNSLPPVSGYNVPNSAYNQIPNVSQQVVPSAQIYQHTNASQSISNVTASMDTKTYPYNSPSQYSTANPNMYVYPSQQNPAAFPTNQSNVRSYSGISSNGNINTPSPYHNHPQNQNYSIPPIQNQFNNTSNLPTSNIPNSYVYQNSLGNVYVPPNLGPYYQAVSQGIPATPTATFAGTVANMPQMNMQNIPSTISPNRVHQKSSTFPNVAEGTIYASQQSYQLPSNPVNQYNYAMHNAGVSTSNQQVQLPLDVAPVSQPLHPSPTMTAQNPLQVKSPARNVPFAVTESSHLNTIRDLITPPLEKDTTDSTEKDSPKLPVLQPQVIDLKTISQLKEKEAGHLAKDPLEDPSVRAKFVSEVEKYEKFVEGLVRKSLNGTTPLDQKWKELIEAQDKESRKMSISVARCYPLKNRFPDVMPYDSNRVQLSSSKDDYINASHLKDICPGSPVFVITQAPLPATFSDFWLMVWEQQVETLICLLPDNELKTHVYFPKERGSTLPFGGFETALQSYKEKNGFVERMINITHIKNRISRVVVHLQFTQWPISGIPQSPAPLLQFMSDVLSYHKQQRNLLRPVVVHCSAGIGRSGCFSLIISLVNEMNNGHGPRDVAQVAINVSQQRKYIIQDKEQLKFCYDTVLYYAQDLLMKRGILTTRASFDNKLPGSTTTSSHHVRHPSEDFILGSGGLAKLQSGMEKMGLSSEVPTQNVTSSVEPEPDASSQAVGSGDSSSENLIQDCSEPIPEPSAEKIDAAESEAPKEDIKGAKPPITSLLDPSNFNLDATGTPVKRKITKENFANSKGSLSNSSSDSADPLSQLDPLWSLKK